MAKCSEYTKMMQMVEEPGLRNINTAVVDKKSRLSNEANSITNATMAWSKMCEATQPQKKQVVVEQKVDDLKIMGALKAIEEILCGGKEPVTRKNCCAKFSAVKKIVETVAQKDA